ncbi:guanitoxin biosynthesis heme-dependent pre-guanitoxin N-hydroxylase GntA [Luteimonas deserti]|uniref:YqcI/YcgG family protein n=1 Tax=Luteimonas deserti TaxID=2752306 RepID=A0A7Z0QQZ9_9GAMM|nr:guanitoxin biosynthesis heme-dependent pre-guanitoxin N-hydroxylase GntA [Luteimonas deserti]NYZ63252.1 YqcI/YcgG family protein [Luteimonas deserti]
MTACPHRQAPEPLSPDVADASGGDALAARFLAFVDAPEFPCVGSKAALARGAIQPHAFGRLGDRDNDAHLLDALTGFARQVDATDPDDRTVHSFVALFQGPLDTGEQRFEALLWSQLQRLHDLDARRGTRWARDVSRDPDDPRFSLSLAGHPFFVIGLHPGASRLARRFEAPALVFNSHRQFERLRADGRYQKMQAATRERDIALQGSINPNLADFGAAAETRQYSGRAAEPEWTCPFRVRSSA